MMSILPAAGPLKACRGSEKIGDRRSAHSLAVPGHTMFDIMGGNFVARRPPHALVTGNVVERLFQILVSEWRINHERMQTQGHDATRGRAFLVKLIELINDALIKIIARQALAHKHGNVI